MKKFIGFGLAAFVGLLFGLVADLTAIQAAGLACPTFVYGLVPTAGQWQACFDAKQNALGYTPVNRSGDTMTGRLALPPATASNSPLNVPHGTAPTVPINGDLWSTTSGLFTRINGVTFGPLSAMPVYNITGTQQNPLHAVFGSATLSGGAATVTLSGSAVFTSNSTYKCFSEDNSGTVASTSITLTSGTAFSLKGTTTNTVSYFCIGN